MTDELKRQAICYHDTRDRANEILVEALCHTFHLITGKEATDRIREAFFEAVRFH